MTFMSSESTGLGNSTDSGCDVALTMRDSMAGRRATILAATSCFTFKLILSNIEMNFILYLYNCLQKNVPVKTAEISVLFSAYK